MKIASAVKFASIVCAVLLAGQTGQGQENAASTPNQVHVVITDSAFRLDKELPPLTAKDVKLKLAIPLRRARQRPLWSSLRGPLR